MRYVPAGSLHVSVSGRTGKAAMTSRDGVSSSYLRLVMDRNSSSLKCGLVLRFQESIVGATGSSTYCGAFGRVHILDESNPIGSLRKVGSVINSIASTGNLTNTRCIDLTSRWCLFQERALAMDSDVRGPESDTLSLLLFRNANLAQRYLS